MAGHNKWSQIKHKKAKEDAKKGKTFAKLSKEITVAAKEGGGDPGMNPRLRTLLEKGREANMPLDNIKRAIQKGTGELPGAQYEHMTYEGYGPSGIAVIVETLTDNKNRTVADLRHLFSSEGGSLGETGSVNWMFARKGVIRGHGNTTEEQLVEDLIEYDIHDVKHDGDWFSIFCDPKSLDEVKKAAQASSLSVESAEIEWVPQNTVSLEGSPEENALSFLSELQDHDDVKNVYTNLA